MCPNASMMEKVVIYDCFRVAMEGESQWLGRAQLNKLGWPIGCWVPTYSGDLARDQLMPKRCVEDDDRVGWSLYGLMLVKSTLVFRKLLPTRGICVGKGEKAQVVTSSTCMS